MERGSSARIEGKWASSDVFVFIWALGRYSKQLPGVPHPLRGQCHSREDVLCHCGSLGQCQEHLPHFVPIRKPFPERYRNTVICPYLWANYSPVGTQRHLSVYQAHESILSLCEHPQNWALVSTKPRTRPLQQWLPGSVPSICTFLDLYISISLQPSKTISRGVSSKIRVVLMTPQFPP